MLSPVLIWLIIGSIFCLMELIFPTAFVELMMGLSAILVAGFALFIPYDNVLIILWMLFSIGLIFLTKKYIVTRKKEPLLLEESEAITISSI
jgi:membrane protein implicated in regulation of membrane protease activity